MVYDGGRGGSSQAPECHPISQSKVLATTYPQAGLVSREDAEKLLIALEPEAASVYCRKLRLHQLMDLSSRTAGGGRLGERRSIDSSFRHGKRPRVAA